MKILITNGATNNEIDDTVADYLLARDVIRPIDPGPAGIADESEVQYEPNPHHPFAGIIALEHDAIPDYDPKPQYSCTFLFWRGQVLLVRKSHPEWQNGRYNGIGGEAEPGEPPSMCASRELLEETGLRGIDAEDLTPFCMLEDSRVIVHFFRADLPDSLELPNILPPTNDIGESLYLCPASNEQSDSAGPLPWQDREQAIENLGWLIPMALDKFHVTGLVQARRRVLVEGVWEPTDE